MSATKPKQSNALALNKPSSEVPARNGGRFVKGQTANPHGRPRHSRERLSNAFFDELALSFEHKGKKAIASLADKDPATYVRVIASLMPKEIRMDAGPLAELGQQELDALAKAARKAVELAQGD
jgi:hypothetical protein